MAGRNVDEKLRCSFCNKTQDQVKKLIAGPNGAYICDECVGICADILDEEFENEEDVKNSLASPLLEDNLKGRINRDALFSSETEDYRMPMEPDADDDVLLRMRTAKGNVDHVYYVEDKAEVEMTKAKSDELFDYYEYEITVGTDQVLYHFKVVNAAQV